MSDKCTFSQNSWCGALSSTQCDGLNTACSFYKTKKQFTEDRNRAIMLNRRKGNCTDCKYVSAPCELSENKCGFGGVND